MAVLPEKVHAARQPIANDLVVHTMKRDDGGGTGQEPVMQTGAEDDPTYATLYRGLDPLRAVLHREGPDRDHGVGRIALHHARVPCAIRTLHSKHRHPVQEGKPRSSENPCRESMLLLLRRRSTSASQDGSTRARMSSVTGPRSSRCPSRSRAV